ncbi:TNF receptor-associated factor 4-like isoform X2 [Dysidea avara]|uniref:TNF receptor-associated factor 4-like isoform X2 n=1 Tax=Dysidea avara TaxID=196820 RepID=UPI00332EB544
MAIATPSEIGGYEYKFVDTTPDRYICIICHLPSQDPYLSVCCGHVFCKSCLDNAKKATTFTNACPVCRDEEFVTFPNKQLDREIRSLHVMCTNKERGCEWQGELNDINNHLGNSAGCQFENVKCSNECGKMLQRRYLTSHVETECPYRKVDCQYCHITREHQFIAGEHKEQCSKLPLPCPNKCEVGSVPREDMEAHRKECPLEFVQCEYHNVGCEERMMRKRKKEHEQERMENHLSLTKRKLTDNHQELADTKSQLSNAEQMMNAIMVALHQAAGHSSHHSGATPTVSVAQWWVKLTAMTTMFQSDDQTCPVTINLTEFNKKKKENKPWYSKSYYTHGKGYRMCLRIEAAGNGSGKGTHMSVFLCLMKGPHDDELTWPLRGEFEIKLLNQISDYICSGRVIDTDRARSRGWPRFISNEDLHGVTPTCQFLKDDCIYLQVSKL